MSLPDIDVSQLSDAKQSFVVEAAMAEGLSVGVNDIGEIVVTCRTHDGDATVSATHVFGLAERNGLHVVDALAHMDDGEMEVVVGGSGWQNGGGEE